VTSLKWYDENVITFSSSNGTLQLNDIRIKQGSAIETVSSNCSLVSKAEGAIWDTALWRNGTTTMIVSAEDSGRITLSDPRMLEGVVPIVLTVSNILN
jgi:hypothetical protein